MTTLRFSPVFPPRCKGLIPAVVLCAGFAIMLSLAACGRRTAPQPAGPSFPPTGAVKAWQREGRILVAWLMPASPVVQRLGGLEEFEVREVWDPGHEVDTDLYQRFKTLAAERAGDRYYSPLEDQFVSSPALDTDDDDERKIVLGLPEQFGSIEIIPLHSDDDLDGPAEPLARARIRPFRLAHHRYHSTLLHPG